MTTTNKPAPVPAVRKTVPAVTGAYLNNKHWQEMEALKVQSFLGRLVVVKTDKMPTARVGLVTYTNYQKGRNVGNTFLTITFNDGRAITIDWRQGGYSLRLATGSDFVGMFPQEDDEEMMPDCGLSEVPSVEASGESLEDMLREVAGLNEAAEIPEIVVEDSSLPNFDF